MRGLVLALALAAAACGTTRIVASDRQAAIYIDGELAGRGSAELRRRGGPGAFDVEVRARDGRRASRRVSRSITGTTVVGALFTYGICLLACWELPSEVAIDLPAAPNGWEEHAAADGDPWLRDSAPSAAW
jgi:hypothetical protein